MMPELAHINDEAHRNHVLAIANAVLEDRKSGTHHTKVGPNEAKARAELARTMQGDGDAVSHEDHTMIVRHGQETANRYIAHQRLGKNIDVKA